MTSSASDNARQVRLLIIDIDGVLTDGGLTFDNRGEEYKTFNSLDGHGIRMLLDCGIEVAVITGRNSEIVNHRMGELGVDSQRLLQREDRQVPLPVAREGHGVDP